MQMQEVRLDIVDQGHSADYVGVNTEKTSDGSYEYMQCALIDAIIDAIIDDVDIGNSYNKRSQQRCHSICMTSRTLQKLTEISNIAPLLVNLTNCLKLLDWTLSMLSIKLPSNPLIQDKNTGRQ
jgi:hypothetical protein